MRNLDGRLKRLETNLIKPETFTAYTAEETTERIHRLLTEEPESEAARRVALLLERARVRRAAHLQTN